MEMGGIFFKNLELYPPPPYNYVRESICWKPYFPGENRVPVEREVFIKVKYAVINYISLYCNNVAIIHVFSQETEIWVFYEFLNRFEELDDLIKNEV